MLLQKDLEYPTLHLQYNSIYKRLDGIYRAYSDWLVVINIA